MRTSSDMSIIEYTERIKRGLDFFYEMDEDKYRKKVLIKIWDFVGEHGKNQGIYPTVLYLKLAQLSNMLL